MEETKKKYELLEVREDGVEVRLYADGSKRNQNGQLLEAPPGAVVITPENSREYIARRKQKILDEIEKGIQDVTKTSAPAEAIGAIVKKRAEVAMKDETRTGNEAAKIVLAAVDAYQDKRAPEGETVQRHEYALDAETREILEKMIEARRGNVIDVEVSE